MVMGMFSEKDLEYIKLPGSTNDKGDVSPEEKDASVHQDPESAKDPIERIKDALTGKDKPDALVEAVKEEIAGL